MNSKFEFQKKINYTQIFPRFNLTGQKSTILENVDVKDITTEQLAFITKTIASSEFTDCQLVDTRSMMDAMANNEITFSLPLLGETHRAIRLNNDEFKSPYYDEIWMGKQRTKHSKSP